MQIFRKHLSASYRGEETLKKTKLTELCDGRKVPFFLGKPCPSQDNFFKVLTSCFALSFKGFFFGFCGKSFMFSSKI